MRAAMGRQSSLLNTVHLISLEIALVAANIRLSLCILAHLIRRSQYGMVRRKCLSSLHELSSQDFSFQDTSRFCSFQDPSSQDRYHCKCLCKCFRPFKFATVWLNATTVRLIQLPRKEESGDHPSGTGRCDRNTRPPVSNKS